MRIPFRPPPRRREAPSRGDFALGLLGIVVPLAWIVLVVYAVHPALPYSSIRIPGSGAVNRLVLAPQGWGFFTRNPREERQFVYGRSADGWRPLLQVPHGRPANAMGLDRASRAQGVEMGLLLTFAAAADWRPCEGEIGGCLDTLAAGKAIRNPSPNPTMCGTVAVVLQPPVPWAWLKAPSPVQMPSRIVPLEVSC